MRFATLDLLAFGHFTNETLTFAPRPGVVELVYGDNEAGKSTSLRAVTAFLYGIPARTTDDFEHPMPTLRVGATLLDADGKAVSAVRRKGLKDTVRDLSDAPIDSGVIDRMLGGLDRELFEQMYALSREDLQRGAADLLTGNGALGEALFGASLGLAGINDVLKALEEDAAAIFKPQGHNPSLNMLVTELDSLRKRARDAELRPAEYQDIESGLAHALEGREQLDAEFVLVEAELQRAQRNQQLIPLVARRELLLAHLEEFGDTPVLASSAREERIAAERELETAAAEIARGERKLAELREALEKLVPRAPLLARDNQIRGLHKTISAHEKAADDLPAIKATYRVTMQRAEALLRETHPERTLADVEDLRPSPVARDAIGELSNEHVRLAETKRLSDRALTDSTASLARAKAHAESLRVPADVAPLRAAFDAAQKLGDIESELASNEATIAAIEQQLVADLAALGFSGSVGDIEALPVPTDAAVARFIGEQERLAAARTAVSSQSRAVEVRLAEERQALAALDLAGVVPTEADLSESRAYRADQWRAVRDVLEDDIHDAGLESTAKLADAFEETVRAADDVADRLRREADRVAAKASIEAAIGRFEREHIDLQGQGSAVEAEAALLELEWHELWKPTTIEPKRAAEMREWLLARARIVELARSLRTECSRHEGRSAAVIGHREALGRELRGLGRSLADETSLAATLALAHEIIEAHDARATAVESARERIVDAEHRAREASAALAEAVADLEEWLPRWTSEVSKLGIDPAMKPDQARRIVGALDEMFALLAAAGKDKARIDGIERDAAVFSAAVAEIVGEVAAQLVGLSEDRALTQLLQILDVAQREATRAESLETQISELEASLEDAIERRRRAEQELARLVKDAHCGTRDALATAEERSTEMLGLRDRLSTVEEQMTMLGAVTPDEIVAQVQGLDIALVEAEMHQLAKRKTDLSQRREQLGEEVGQKRTLLEAMTGSDDAAELYAEAESVKAEIRMQAEQYARLRIAAAILRRQIDEFRERSHGPLLTRASYFFSKLTCGKYLGLGTGFDSKGKVVLLARRKNGSEIMVEQMSTGTRDQLYLALRLSTLEQQAQRTEPLPLIVDDLFEGYDNKRAAAGFEALAEVAEKTQVIFFTHHPHLVELARRTLHTEQCEVQEIAEPTVASAAAA
jgi:uncharacterized protein YhaN